MSKTRGGQYNIGKEAGDLLYKGYDNQPPIRINNYSLHWISDITCKVKQTVPGLSTLFGFTTPNYGRVEVQYENGLAEIAGGIGLIRDSTNSYNPIASFSGVVGGGSLFSIGTDLAFNISTSAFEKFNSGLSFNSDFVIASLSLDMLETLKASCYHMVNPLTNTALAAELKHSFSINDTALTIGAQHAFSPSTMARARVSTHGNVGIVMQQEIWQKIFVSISGEVDFFGLNRSPEIGLSLAVRL